jgi:acetoacetyl-CoA synthetase
LVSALACGATLVLYDGSPFSPDANVLFDYAEQEQISFFGTSAKYLDACRKERLEPKHTHYLPALRMLASTGSPLAAETFDWVILRRLSTLGKSKGPVSGWRLKFGMI